MRKPVFAISHEFIVIAIQKVIAIETVQKLIEEQSPKLTQTGSTCEVLTSSFSNLRHFIIIIYNFYRTGV